MYLVDGHENQITDDCCCGDDAVDQVNTVAGCMLSTEVATHLANRGVGGNYIN